MECMQDAGKEDYLRPSERIGLDWIEHPHFTPGRKQGSCLEKEIMQGTMSGARRRGRPRTAWMDNINTWTGHGNYVHGVTNSRIEGGYKQYRTELSY